MSAIQIEMLDPADAATPDDAEMERLVQAIVELTMRKGAVARLDAVRQGLALLEAMARYGAAIATVSPKPPSEVAAEFGALLTQMMLMRIAGEAPGAGDVAHYGGLN